MKFSYHPYPPFNQATTARAMAMEMLETAMAAEMAVRIMEMLTAIIMTGDGNGNKNGEADDNTAPNAN